MPKFHLTNKAVEDLGEIWNYTFDTWSESQADKYYLELLEKCKEVTENPSLGKVYDGILKSLKGYKVNTHIIFYRALSHQEIERILHQKMDLRKHLNE